MAWSWLRDAYESTQEWGPHRSPLTLPPNCDSSQGPGLHNPLSTRQAEPSICKHDVCSLGAPLIHWYPPSSSHLRTMGHFLDRPLHSSHVLASVSISSTSQAFLGALLNSHVNSSTPCSSVLCPSHFQVSSFSQFCGYKPDLVIFWNGSTLEVIKFTLPTLWPQPSPASNFLTRLPSTFWFFSWALQFIDPLLCPVQSAALVFALLPMYTDSTFHHFNNSFNFTSWLDSSFATHTSQTNPGWFQSSALSLLLAWLLTLCQGQINSIL